MKLRPNKAFTVFIFTLFSIGFFSPYLLAGFSKPVSTEGKTYIVDGGHHTNLLCPLLAEELMENLEGRDKIPFLVSFTPTNTLLSQLENNQSPFRQASVVSHKHNTEPLIFKLNCTFRI